MNIYIINLNQIALLLLKPLNFLGIKVNYLNNKTNKKFNIRENSNLNPISFNNKNIKAKRLLKIIDFGENDVLQEQINKLLPQEILKKIADKFHNIENINQKLKFTLISKFNFNDIGRIYVFDILNFQKDNNIIIIHTNLHSFMCKENGVNIKKKTIHLYIPTDDIHFILSLIRNILILFKKKIKSIFLKLKINNKDKYKNHINKMNTAVLIHDSINYGENLYYKNHYFSSNNNSKLNINNVLLLTLNKSNKLYEYNNKPIINIKNKITLNLIYKAIKNISRYAIYLKSLRELYGLIFIFIFYLKYISWIEFFNDFKIKNIIYDYDILFSKSLSLALDSCGIKTIAIQERSANSNALIYPIFVDTYLYAGSIAQKYGLINRSIFHKNFYNLGMWRVSYFYKRNLISAEKIKFRSMANDNALLKEKKILFLGFFLDHSNSYPFLNYKSLNQLIEYIKISSKKFPKAALILRMKILKKNDVEFIMKRCKEIKNFYLCDDYDSEAISYRLCKDSDLIISVQTSLAEESLAFGKKVIFINDNYPIKKMTQDVYTKEFLFTISRNKSEFLKLAEDCLNNKEELNKKYKILKDKLSGSIDLSIPNIIPDTIESFLV